MRPRRLTAKAGTCCNLSRFQLGPPSLRPTSLTGEIVMVTGSIDHPNLTATWTWNGFNWVRHILIEPPQGVVRGQMLWDPPIRRIVLIGFAGDNSLHMWVWAGTSYGWQQLRV